MSSQEQGNADHDVLIGIRETQKSSNIEVERRFQQVTKEVFEICSEIKDLTSDMKDGFCKTDKRIASLDKAITIQEIKQVDNEKFRDAVTTAISKTAQDYDKKIAQVYTEMDTKDTAVDERNQKKMEVSIAIASIISGVIGLLIGLAF